MPAVASEAPDIRVENHGSIVLLRPVTTAGREWLRISAVHWRHPLVRAVLRGRRRRRGPRGRAGGAVMTAEQTSLALALAESFESSGWCSIKIEFTRRPDGTYRVVVRREAEVPRALR
jgi:hypothetical protein